MTEFHFKLVLMIALLFKKVKYSSKNVSMQGANSVYNLKWYSIMESSPTLAGGDQMAGARRSHPPRTALLRI